MAILDRMLEAIGRAPHGARRPRAADLDASRSTPSTSAWSSARAARRSARSRPSTRCRSTSRRTARSSSTPPRATKGDAAIAAITALTKDPEVGDEFTGKVVKTTDFGAFVELKKGTDGLLHVSNVGPGRVNHIEDVLARGDVVEVVVQEVDKARGRIGLKLIQKHEDGKLVSPEELVERAKNAPPREPQRGPPAARRRGRGGRGGPAPRARGRPLGLGRDRRAVRRGRLRPPSRSSSGGVLSRAGTTRTVRSCDLSLLRSRLSLSTTSSRRRHPEHGRGATSCGVRHRHHGLPRHPSRETGFRASPWPRPGYRSPPSFLRAGRIASTSPRKRRGWVDLRAGSRPWFHLVESLDRVLARPGELRHVRSRVPTGVKASAGGASQPFGSTTATLRFCGSAAIAFA